MTESSPWDEDSEFILGHTNDSYQLYFSLSVRHSNQQYIDTLAVIADSFAFYLRVVQTRGQGTLYVRDQRDSTMLTITFMENETLRKTFYRRPYRTILTFKEFAGRVDLGIAKKGY